MVRTSTSLAAVLIPALLLGCGGDPANLSPEKAEEVQLKQVSELLREYQLSNGKPPKTLKDLAGSSGSSPGAYELISKGDVVVQLGAALPDTKEEPGGSPSEEVLAYVKKVPESGGAVLLLNRTIQRMSADEFKSAKTAGATSTAKAAASTKAK